MDLTSSTFDSTILQATTPVLVDFWAPWCGPCKVMEPVLEALEHEMSEITIHKVNCDDAPDLTQRYNILSIPTYVVFKGGQVVGQFSGAMTKETLKERIAALLG